ncbi:SAV_6107 family HEPN domain-containing protein [Actinomycetospora flava]|uniref:SAV_6107 family HEPN domain-containing protein n=1 Tax=Actinomycetospora flava TaxID=3129232 RepID=A0ABU8M430_9PSEU
MTSALAMPGLFDTTPDDEPAGSPAPARPTAVPAPAPGREGRPVRSATRGATGRSAESAAPAPPPPPPSRTVVQLLGAARDELRAAQAADDPADRFCSAHLGALRAAAAVLALRARSKRASRPTDAWTLLASVAPEYGEWAAFFAAHSATRSAVEAGVRGRVSQRDADDMVRQADLFLALVTRTVAGRGR